MKLPQHFIDALGADPANCVTASGENPRLDRWSFKAQRADSHGSKSARAMLIKRVYEVDPLECEVLRSAESRV